MYLTLVLFRVFSALMAIDLEDIGFFCPEIFDLDPDKSRGRFDFMQALVAIVLVCQNVATNLLILWRSDWLSEEIGFAVCFVAKRMETHVDVAGVFIEIALCWSFVDWAKSAGLDETIDLSSFRLGPNVWTILE